MKILRKNDDFKKISEKTPKDLIAVKNLLDHGWTYCAKRVYKDFSKTDEKLTEKIENVEKSKNPEIAKSTKKKIVKIR
jgi:hypothetical protein